MDRWVVLIVTVVLVVGVVDSSAQGKYGGGTGELNDPYLIYTAEQMNEIGLNEDDWDKHFKLMANIDLSSFTGTSFNIIGTYANPFTGVFDGNGHTISNFTYDSNDTNRTGLFGYVSGEIKDLGLINPNVDAGAAFSTVGSLVSRLSDGTITNCYVEGGSVAGTGSAGGLVGGSSGTITNCYSEGNVSGGDEAGGLVGYNSGTISNCYSSATVTGTHPMPMVGGLVGYNSGTITDCYSEGDVSGDERVGGLVGDNRGRITNCYEKADVSGDRRVGGLVGINYSTISNCYSTGSVSGRTLVGGLVGDSLAAVTDSFWDIETSGQTTSFGGTGKTTAEMQTMSTFTDAGWDFVGQPDGPSDIWAEPSGGGYPILWWQLSPLPALPTFSGGTGEANDPYFISTAAELNSIGHNPRLMKAHFKLINDIDLAGVDFYIIATSRAYPYSGVFDGNGEKIYNFTYTSTDRNCIGLFGYVRGENAVIKDLGLIDPNVNAGTGDCVGSLVGCLYEGTISRCYVEGGSVSGNDYVGGLVGFLVGFDYLGFNYIYTYSTITNSYATGSVSGDERVGGLVGYNYRGTTITNCYSEGDVSGDERVGGLVGGNRGTISNCYSEGDVSGDERVGGLVGYNWGDTISESYSSGSVSGNKNVGGLVGTNGTYGAYSTITNSYATGSVSGDERVGGLVGINDTGRITNCYSTGSVAGVDWAIGGLVGDNWAMVSSSFWDIETSGQTWGVGTGSSSGISGKTTAEMQTMSTFTDAGWDFVGETINGTEDIWRLSVEGTSYPQLNWQFPLGDFVPPDGYVDYWDLLYFAQRWHCSPSDNNWDPRCDLAKEDNYVDYWDLLVFAQQWHKGVKP